LASQVGDCWLQTVNGDVGSNDVVIRDETSVVDSDVCDRVDEVDAKTSSRLLSRIGEPTSCVSPSGLSISASPTSMVVGRVRVELCDDIAQLVDKLSDR